GRVEPADHLPRADAEHGQPDRRGVRARLLRLDPDRGRSRVPRARQPGHLELGRDAVLGAGQLDRVAGRVVDVRVPRVRARADRGGARVHPRRTRRGQQSAAAPAEDPAQDAVRAAPGTGASGMSAVVATRELLRLEDLSVDYVLPAGPVRAVDGVSLSIAPGEILGLAGESGCGKSTLAIAVLQTLKRPARVSSGRIMFRGDDLAAMSPQELRKVRWRHV